MADYTVNDRRAAHRGNSGLIVGQSVASAKAQSQAERALALGRQGAVPTDAAEARRMGLARMSHAKMASAPFASGSGTTNLSFASQRPRDPFFYWQQNNLPYDLKKADHLVALRQLCRHIYASHPVMASAIDIFSKWPITEMELTCKDDALTDFYTELFIEQLDYEEFLGDLGREYWTVGEAWPLGSFNEDLGVWEDDELLNPDDVFVEKSPFLKDPRFYIRLPESLRRVLQTGQPVHEYLALMRSYPELKHFTHDNAKMPVSNVLLKQLRFKADTFNPRGIPIMFRGLRALMQEEMLNSAQDAIADRLYTPLIIAKIGASATDLGTQNPWIPTDAQIAVFESSLDAALAADFRVLTTHFAVDMQSVFGRETMPNMDADFDRLTEKELQVFGLSKTMLSGAGSGETYAADALNRDLVSQLLSTYQRYIRKFARDRMLVVAEAQEHWDYEVRGGKRYLKMEEVLEVDEESGETKIVEQPKLLVPDLRLKAMNMKDEETERQLVEALAAGGAPISYQTRLTNIPIDFEEEVERKRDEQVRLAVEEQETRRATYLELKDKALPVPEDLKADFEPKAIGTGEGEGAAAEPQRHPQLGADDVSTPTLAPDALDLESPPGTAMPETEQQVGESVAPVIPLPVNHLLRQRSRPGESDEMRRQMPRAGSLPVREDMAEHLPGKRAVLDDEYRAVKAVGSDGAVTEDDLEVDGGLIFGPRHVGMRRHAKFDRDEPIGEEPDGETG